MEMNAKVIGPGCIAMRSIVASPSCAVDFLGNDNDNADVLI